MVAVSLLKGYTFVCFMGNLLFSCLLVSGCVYCSHTLEGALGGGAGSFSAVTVFLKSSFLLHHITLHT